MMEGKATPEGTLRYQKRFEGKLPPEHFRSFQGLQVSSIGIGTYLGNHDAQTDGMYIESVKAAIRSGCNFIDSAINYRFQRSERCIGRALSELLSTGEFSRGEIIICTKGGYIPFDTEPSRNPREYFEETFFKPGIFKNRSELVSGCHSISPAYIQNQLECSLKNLQVSCVDVYYLHNPEQQLDEVEEEEFYRRMGEAFKVLESAADEGKIKFYGTATWNGYRTQPGSPGYLSLEKITALAVEIGGESHRFRAIQLPFNLAMTEAVSSPNQKVNGNAMPLIKAAEHFGISVVASASILQSQLARNLPPEISRIFPNLQTDAQRALQFVRSTPGITCALVGMKQTKHVEENMKTAETAPLSREEFTRSFLKNTAR